MVAVVFYAYFPKDTVHLYTISNVSDKLTWSPVNPFTADPVEALYIAILV